jgi:hypothetical protein
VSSLKEEIDQLKAGSFWPPCSHCARVAKTTTTCIQDKFNHRIGHQDHWHTVARLTKCPLRSAMTILTGNTIFLLAISSPLHMHKLFCSLPLCDLHLCVTHSCPDQFTLSHAYEFPCFYSQASACC